MRTRTNSGSNTFLLLRTRTDADPQSQNPRTDADSKFRDPHISACSTFARCLLDRVNGLLGLLLHGLHESEAAVSDRQCRTDVAPARPGVKDRCHTKMFRIRKIRLRRNNQGINMSSPAPRKSLSPL